VKRFQARTSLALFGLSTMFLHPAMRAQSPGADACASHKTSEVPQVAITNGQVYALVNLHDPPTGAYSSPRFE